jgi:hypothetical protein
MKGRRVAPDEDLARGRNQAELKALVLTLSTAVRAANARGRKPTATGPVGPDFRDGYSIVRENSRSLAASLRC